MEWILGQISLDNLPHSPDKSSLYNCPPLPPPQTILTQANYTHLIISSKAIPF